MVGVRVRIRVRVKVMVSVRVMVRVRVSSWGSESVLGLVLMLYRFLICVWLGLGFRVRLGLGFVVRFGISFVVFGCLCFGMGLGMGVWVLFFVWFFNNISRWLVCFANGFLV
jgi:hypothetical protein